MIGAIVFVILIIVIFIVFGIILSLGKGSFLIAGFNTMTKEEKEKYDVISLCKFWGISMFLFAFCIILFLLSELWEMKILFNIGFVLIFAITLFMLVYSNTGNRFKK
jgi:hypothetical protein